MTIDKFIKDFLEINDKEKYINGHIKRQYIPYEEKIAICDKVIKNSCYKEINGNLKYYQNTPIQNQLFALALIQNYTDLEMGNDSVEILKNYNLLEEKKLIGVIFNAIPEYNEMSILLEMMNDDEYENNKSLVSFLDNKIDALNILLKQLETQISERETE